MANMKSGYVATTRAHALWFAEESKSGIVIGVCDFPQA